MKTPEKKAGTTVRTNDSENYDIDLEIECNEDEQEGAPNRCVEPELFSVRRKNQWQQVEAPLNQRCFRGVAEMRPAPLSEELMACTGIIVSKVTCRKKEDNSEEKDK